MRDDLARWYRRFHGRASMPVREVLPVPRELADVGELVSVTYRRGAGELREHVFAPASRPVLARDDQGRALLVGGAYRVTERGIEDMHGSMNGSALALRDSRQRFTPRGVPVHGLAVPREGLAVVRHNPISALTDMARGAAGALGDAVLVGGVATVGVQASDALLERTPWSEGWRSVAQGVGLGLPGLALLASAPRAGQGLVAAAIVGGAGRWARYKQWDRAAGRWLASLMGPAAARSAGSVYSGPLPFDVKVDASEQF